MLAIAGENPCEYPGRDLNPATKTGENGDAGSEYPKIHPTETSGWLAALAELAPHLNESARADVLAVARGLASRQQA